MKNLKLMKQVGVLLTIAFIVLCCSCSPPKPIEYEYTLFPDGWRPVGINNKGEVAGNIIDSKTGAFQQGFIYSNGEFKELLPDGLESARAGGINNNGEVWFSDGRVYSNGMYTQRLPLDRFQSTYAYDINDNGEAVGVGVISFTGMLFVYSNGEFTELLPDGWEDVYVEAYHINNNGTVVGYGKDAKGLIKFFIYSNGKYKILSQPYGVSKSCEVVDINDNGDFVVWLAISIFHSDSRGNSFIYRNGKYTEIVPQGVRNFKALAMNNNGDVIGKGFGKGFDDLTGEGKNYIYYNDGPCKEVILAEGIDVTVVDINDYGEITGYLRHKDATTQGFIAVPK